MMKAVKFTKNKHCPWCERQLGLIELLVLDEHSPSKCKKCGKFIGNSQVNSIISVVVPVILCFIAVYLLGIPWPFSLTFLLLIPILRILLAEPSRYKVN